MTIENEELDEAALFNDAVETDPEIIPEPVAAEIEPEKAEVVAESELTAEKPAVDDNAPQVPSWRVREINEEKRAAIAERDALLAERANWQRQQTTEQTKPAEKPAKPDPLLDPEGYETYLENKFEEKRINDQREFDLRLTRQSNVETFDKAYAESQRLKDARDPAFLELSQKMHNTNAPGKVLLDWYQQRMTQAEIGNDLTAYKAKLREEALKDPDFRKAAMEAWRAEAQPQNNGRPRVELPPSLNGASRSNASLRSSQDDVSDAELFAQTTG